MVRDVREYFKSCHAPEKKRIAYIGIQLARGGIDDMDTLCELLASEPEKVSGIRNIGPKSMKLICSVCAVYGRRRSGIP